MTSSNLSFKRAQPLMGTTLELSLSVREELEFELPHLLDAHQFQDLLSRAFIHAREASEALSYFDPTSLLSQYNRGEWAPRGSAAAAGGSVRKNSAAELVCVRGFPAESKTSTAAEGRSSTHHFQALFEATLLKAQSLNARFPKGFVLNATHATHIDLSGIAKGAVVDEVYCWIEQELRRVLDDEFIEVAQAFEWTVNAGGDLRTNGAAVVEVRVPSQVQEDKRYNLQMLASAVATSSHQALNMLVGTPAARYETEFKNSSRASTATVIASSCCWADAFTKVAFQYDLAQEISGEEAAKFGLLAVLNFDEDGELLSAHEWND